MTFGHDPELPGGFQDADLEWDERRKRANIQARLRRMITVTDAHDTEARGTFNGEFWTARREHDGRANFWSIDIVVSEEAEYAISSAIEEAMIEYKLKWR